MVMKPSSIRYYFREGFSGLLKNRLMTVASMATVAACILIMSFSYCMVNNLQYMLQQLEDDIGIAAFMPSSATAEQVETVKAEIEAIEHVTDVEYVSPDAALEDLKQQLDADDILAGLEGENNPLSNSFNISIDDINNQQPVLESLNVMKANGELENIKDAHSETEVLVKVNTIITVIGVLVIAILVVISVVIIVNTIKISVFTRKTEINIMKYVGATDWFIRWPFIIEGVLIGLIGALIPMVIAWPCYAQSVNMIYEYFPIIKNMVTFRQSSEIFSILLPSSLAFGILLGVVGSVTSIRKHLKV